MYKISVELKKGQLRDTSPQEVLELIAEELRIQNAENIDVQEGRILFKNPVLCLPKNRFFNKFASFSNGEITVTSQDNTYLVFLNASINRIFLHTALIVVILNLFEVLSLGFSSGILFTWLIIFPFITVVRLVMHYLFFPVYFTSLRNNLESTLKRPLSG